MPAAATPHGTAATRPAAQWRRGSTSCGSPPATRFGSGGSRGWNEHPTSRGALLRLLEPVLRVERLRALAHLEMQDRALQRARVAGVTDQLAGRDLDAAGDRDR